MNIWIVQCLLSFVVWGTFHAGEHEVHRSLHETVHMAESGGEHPIVIVHPPVISHPVEARQITGDSSIYGGGNIPKSASTTTVISDQVVGQVHKIGSDPVDARIVSQDLVEGVISPLVIHENSSGLQQPLVNAINGIIETLQESAKILQSDPTNSAAKTSINNFSKKLDGLKKKIEKIEIDDAQRKIVEEGIQSAQKIVDEFGSAAKSKAADVKSKKLRSVTEPTKISSADIPSLPAALKPNTFGDQEQLPHQGETIKKQVAGLLTAFPYELSPARGMIDIANGSLEKKYDVARQSGDKNSLITKLFYTLDGQIAQTHQGGNFAMSLSPEIIGQLIRIITTDPTMLLQLDEDFLKNWHASYLAAPMPEEQRQLKNPKYFKDEAKDFLKSLKDQIKDEASKQKAIDLLLSYMVMDIQDAGIVAADYAKGLGIEFKPVYYTDEDYKKIGSILLNSSFTDDGIKKILEQCIFFFTNANGIEKYVNLNIQILVYEGKTFTSCKETVLRQLTNLILYNPKTESLDLNMLPETIQQSISPEFKEFILIHGKKIGDNKEAMQAFVDLIENKSSEGIQYKNGNYELTGDIENAVIILKMLFGIKANKEGLPIEQFKSILETLFTTKERNITFTVNAIGNLNFEILSKNFATKGALDWGPQHGSLSVQVDKGLDKQSIQKLFLAGKLLNKFLIKISPDLDNALQEVVYALKTEHDYVTFFRNYADYCGQKIAEIFNKDVFKNRLVAFINQGKIETAINITKAMNDLGLNDLGLNDEDFLLQGVKSFSDINALLVAGIKPSITILKIIDGKFNLTKNEKTILLKKLFEKGLNQKDAIEFALKQPRKIPFLIDCGLNINYLNDQGITPLMQTVFDYNESTFKALLKAGADLSIHGSDGKTISDVLVDEIEKVINLIKAKKIDVLDKKVILLECVEDLLEVSRIDNTRLKEEYSKLKSTY